MGNLEHIGKRMRESCPDYILQISCIKNLSVPEFLAQLVLIEKGNNGSEKARGRGISLDGALQSLELDYRTKYVRKSKHGG
jgi:hypothetical protein